MSSPNETRHIWNLVNKIAKSLEIEPNTVYLWAVKQIVPPKEFDVHNSISDDFIAFWDEKGIGYTAEKETVGGEMTTTKITKGISGFTTEETDKIIRLLEAVALKYKIPTISKEEEDLFRSYL